MRPRGGRLPHGRVGPAALKPLGFVELKVLLVVAIAGYLGIAGLVWMGQESLLFYPRPALGEPRAPASWTLVPVYFQARDGKRLAGVLVRPPVERPPLVIYYGGNAEEVTEYASAAATDYGPRAVLLVNYRGYGKSEGKPSEKALVADALELYDWAAARADIDPARIALHGRSLGGGVAVQVAAARPAKCVMLTSPFASVREVAQELYAWLPVSLLLRHPFDSAALAPSIKAPLLVLVGGDDTLIRPHHSERLASLWAGPVERASFAGFGHNDLHLHPGYGTAIRGFLGRCH